MIERYLNTSPMLKAVFLLIDIRHEPSANDRNMYDWIIHNGFQPIIIATKLDKIKRSQVQKQVKLIRTGLMLWKVHRSSHFLRKPSRAGRRSGELIEEFPVMGIIRAGKVGL